MGQSRSHPPDEGATLSCFSAGRLVEAKELADFLLEAGVETGGGQVHCIGQAFDDSIDRGKTGVRFAVGQGHGPWPMDGIVLYVDSPQSEQAVWAFSIDK